MRLIDLIATNKFSEAKDLVYERINVIVAKRIEEQKKALPEIVFEEVIEEAVRRTPNVVRMGRIKKIRRRIRRNKKGKIITISSLYGVVSPMHFLYKNSHKHIGYCLSKSSIIMMTKYLATLYGKNFNINSVVLGGVSNSEINKSFVKNYSKLNPKKKNDVCYGNDWNF